MSGFYYSWNNKGIVRLCQGKEASILRSHEETRKLPGKRDYARYNATDQLTLIIMTTRELYK